MRALLAAVGLLAFGGAAHAAPDAGSCYIHYWPAQIWRGEIPGGPLGVGYYEKTRKLPQVSDLIEAQLSDEAELGLIRTIDFGGITGSRPLNFVLETTPVEEPGKIKAGVPLRTPESDCYVEILQVGSLYTVDPIWGVAFGTAARLRYFEGGTAPVLWKLTDHRTKIRHALARTSAPDVSLAEDIKDAFQINMRANVEVFASALKAKRGQR